MRTGAMAPPLSYQRVVRDHTTVTLEDSARFETEQELLVVMAKQEHNVASCSCPTQTLLL
jgi:hypothetical protein